jgi:hypothetical protein
MNRLTIVLLSLALASLAACGPAFTVDPKYLAGYDAGERLEVEPGADAAAIAPELDASPRALDAGEIRRERSDAGDAGELADVTERIPVDAGERLEAAAPVDAGGELDAPADAHAVTIDAGGPPPPPPALCCATPCSGSQVALIACGTVQPWTCSAGTCEGNGCEIGAACHWMNGACTGTVEVCP